MALPSAQFLRELRRNDEQVFVETGTHRGDGVNVALNAGFPCIYSCEINPFDYGWASHRFWWQRDRVHLALEPSVKFLMRLVPKLTTRAVFFLDAHYCASGGGVKGKCPLMDELGVIRTYSVVKDHVILIDDARFMLTQQEGFPRLQDVKLLLLRGMNRRFRFYLRNSRDFKDDILVVMQKVLR